jgi:acetyl-CoA C-acetyltransferase
MEKNMRRVAIIGGARIPFARSFGSYMGISPQAQMTAAAEAVVKKFNLGGVTLGEVAVGAVLRHSRDWNFAREVVLSTSLAPQTPAFDVAQACGTSLETAILIANKIALGQAESGIAGGVDTNSDVPFVFGKRFSHAMLEAAKAKSTGQRIKALLKLRPADLKPLSPAVVEPRTGLNMGQSCELMAKEWRISRVEQDELALASHQKAAKAIADGFYNDLVVPFHGVEKDQVPRADTSIEKLAKLKPVFDPTPAGTLTAGNSSALTDGAAAVLLSSEEWARARGLQPLAFMRDAQTAAVDFVARDGLLMAPTYAVSELLKRNNLKLQDFDFYEIHEAFAAQVLCTLKAWESRDFCRERLGRNESLGAIDRDKLNVKGGSVAMGHPFAATGARIVAGLAKLLAQKGSGRGLISICTGGGMGVAAILER